MSECLWFIFVIQLCRTTSHAVCPLAVIDFQLSSFHRMCVRMEQSSQQMWPAVLQDVAGELEQNLQDELGVMALEVTARSMALEPLPIGRAARNRLTFNRRTGNSARRRTPVTTDAKNSGVSLRSSTNHSLASRGRHVRQPLQLKAVNGCCSLKNPTASVTAWTLPATAILLTPAVESSIAEQKTWVSKNGELAAMKGSRDCFFGDVSFKGGVALSHQSDCLKFQIRYIHRFELFRAWVPFKSRKLLMVNAT